VPSATKLLEKISITATPRAVMRAAGGVGGYFVGHYAGLAYGFFHGLNGAGRGREQFEQIKAERDAAFEKLAERDAEKLAAPAPDAAAEPASKKFTDAVPSREAEGSHAAASLPTSDASDALALR